QAPPTWRVHAFGRVVHRVQEIGRTDLQPLSVFLDDGVVPRSFRDDNYNRLGEDLAKYLASEPHTAEPPAAWSGRGEGWGV
ncbi:MAG TPA: hypothetical protein VJ010_05240, partial [Actinomycetota bacterium]|nr:hypothetical protein [Actinomycetota bacterium]